VIELPPDCDVPDRVGEVSFDVGVPGAESEQRGQQQSMGPGLGR